MKPTHFFQVIGDFGEGGDGRVAADLAQALAESGQLSSCVALKTGGARSLPGPSSAIHEIPSRGGLGRLLLGARRFRALVLRNSPAIIHVHGKQCLPFVSVATAGIPAHRVQRWFTWHDSSSSPSRQGLRWLPFRLALRRAHRVFGSSSAVCADLQEELGVHAEVFRNGVRDHGRTSRAAAQEPTIVWAGRFVPPKDPQIVLRALSRLSSEGLAFRLVMAGAPPPHLQWFLDETRSLAKSLGIADRVDFPGWVADPYALYLRAAIAVQSSHTEGLSIALLEQMMSGLCIVATNVGDTDVAVEDCKSGLLFSPHDLDTLTEHLRTAITQIDKRTKLGSHARERACRGFSYHGLARQAIRSSRGLPPNEHA